MGQGDSHGADFLLIAPVPFGLDGAIPFDRISLIAGWRAMTVDTASLKSAAEELLSAGLLGARWQEGLQALAQAAGSRAATMMRTKNSRPSGHISSAEWVAADEALFAGLAPPSPRQFFPDHAFHGGFCGDTDLYTSAELDRDPYYQDFLRPRGVFWHAKVRLHARPGERVTLSLKRDTRLGPYTPQDIAALDSVIPELKAAVRIGRSMAEAEISGMTRVLHGSGDPVMELDSRGHVIRMHGDGEAVGVLRVHRQCLVAIDPAEQPALERALTAAVRAPRRPAALTLSGQDGERAILQLIPVPGPARDVFAAAAALAVVIPLRLVPPSSPYAGVLRDAFGLTEREADVASLVASGMALSDVAERLQVQIGTARNHLKNIFAKTRVSRQGELVALLARLQ